MAYDLGRVAITGADGFFGWHLRCLLHNSLQDEPRLVIEEDFRSVEFLKKAIGPATTIFHLAGMNRGPEVEVYETNIRLAKMLVQAQSGTNSAQVLLFANSIHSLGDSAFGRSKRRAAQILTEWVHSSGGRFLDVIIPHLFGEGGKPFYNSGFATFCHQLATGGEPQILHDGELELIHAQHAARKFVELALDKKASGTLRLPGVLMRVSEALKRLEHISETYGQGIIPPLSEPLALEFFNTYRSYLFPDKYPVRLQLKTDNRGSLIEAVKSLQGGQTFVSTTHPGITRGRHYHHHKVERFLVLSGFAEIRIRRLKDEQVRVFSVSGDSPCFIDIPTFHTHEITNMGSQDLLTLFWSHEIFDQSNSDTYPEPVVVNP